MTACWRPERPMLRGRSERSLVSYRAVNRASCARAGGDKEPVHRLKLPSDLASTRGDRSIQAVHRHRRGSTRRPAATDLRERARGRRHRDRGLVRRTERPGRHGRESRRASPGCRERRSIELRRSRDRQRLPEVVNEASFARLDHPARQGGRSLGFRTAALYVVPEAKIPNPRCDAVKGRKLIRLQDGWGNRRVVLETVIRGHRPDRSHEHWRSVLSHFDPL